METLTRLYLQGALLTTLLAAGLMPAAASAVPLDAPVIWSYGDRAYLVARDSVWVTAGSTLRFFEKKKNIASGIVVAIEDSTLIVAKVTAGSLARVKHLDRIRVEAERAPSPNAVALRIGYPSSARVQPFFECRRMTLDSHGFVVDTLSLRSYRLVRASPMPARGPDTLVVRMFDDAADEEIALERGELDAAVFWPGEASSHIREQMHWDSTSTAVRTRGLVGVHAPKTGPLPEIVHGIRIGDSRALERLDAELFSGDLDAIYHVEPNSSSARGWSFDVDPALPGRERIRRALGEASQPSESTKRVTLTFIDEPSDRRSFTGDDTDPFIWLYPILCPVISRPEQRPYLESIDLSAIVNLFDCETAGRKR